MCVREGLREMLHIIGVNMENINIIRYTKTTRIETDDTTKKDPNI